MNIDNDLAIALQLQQQFNNVNSQERYVTPKKKSSPVVNLGSPSLEIGDPTPNVHDLFMNFNHLYFWGKLNSVAVRWSKRMYSCAGTCSFSPRAGFCDIALSEPLLKLRPRKDLVETLLHEMIHAYLFVTSNDRDRDGHGPNFLSHMHRINKATNLNISVYHDFHDEVRLYKTHWWRCNGPCQKQKPYFGFVKRSSNRAPGPNDFWWKTHQFNCGGTFVKVKEPEKKQKAKEKNNNNITKKNSNNQSVKDYFSNETKNKQNNTSNSNSVGGVRNGSGTLLLPPKPALNKKSPPSTGNVMTISSLNDRKSTGSILPTISPKNKLNQTNMNNIALNSGKRLSAGDMNTSDSKSITETVRNAWLQKFSSSNNSDGGIKIKRPIDSDCDEDRSKKIIKLENTNDCSSHHVSDVKIKSELDQNCDIIVSSSVDSKEVIKKETGQSSSQCDQDELSLYYSMPSMLINDCNHIMRPLYGFDFTLNESHFKTSHVSSDLWQKASELEEKCNVQCPICNCMYSRSKIDEHVNICLESGPSTSSAPTNRNSTGTNSLIIDLSKNDFLNESDSSDNAEISYINKDSPNSSQIPTSDPNAFTEDDYCNCPLCNKRLNRNDAEEHLEQCLSMTFIDEPVLEAAKPDSEEIKAEDDIIEENDNPKKVTCPCCFKLFDDSEINRHLDDCIL